MTVEFVTLVQNLDLVFGLVGAIGVDLEYVQSAIDDALKSFSYESFPISVTSLMREVRSDVVIDETDLSSTYNTKIDYANDLRRRFNANDILAALAISAIRNTRQNDSDSIIAENDPKRAFVVRQLKTPEEVILFRRVYGRQFILVSIYGSPTARETHLASKIQIAAKGTIGELDAREAARDLIARDQKEEITHGQNVSNAFPLGDVFVDTSDRDAASSAIERFVKALFGSNEISPSRDEYGMYLAKSASLRSSDLSRQVGAAIFIESGEVASLGSNEVPRAGGGTYWTGDFSDSRDIKQGHDPNELNKLEIFSEVVDCLFQDALLSQHLLGLGTTRAVVEKILEGDGGKKYRDARVMDIMEFGRIIHAEMSAICDAARNGVTIKGATLFVTTFPCHMCAKHIVASGISRVVYLEPYPKSYARQLHSDSIQIETSSDHSKVAFVPFIGISPVRYRDLFEKGKRKGRAGEARKWAYEPRRPMIDVFVPAHTEAEAAVVAQLALILAG